jgi:hypothetical protein
MKTTLFSILAAATLFVSTPSFAAAPAANPFDNRKAYDRLNDRNDRDFNYGYDRKHRVTPQERARWEAAHRNDRFDDRRDNRNDDRRDNRFDDRNSRDFNYGFDKSHRVTAKERARWEAAHRYDGRR